MTKRIERDPTITFDQFCHKQLMRVKWRLAWQTTVMKRKTQAYADEVEVVTTKGALGARVHARGPRHTKWI